MYKMIKKTMALEEAIGWLKLNCLKTFSMIDPCSNGIYSNSVREINQIITQLNIKLQLWGEPLMTDVWYFECMYEKDLTQLGRLGKWSDDWADKWQLCRGYLDK